ncbi:MAG: gliding motility lipoprotein GldH [Bacteroidaceae bacterium]|nr:gliding motility lipoprotein GldH [Bacteroidaceae bacterium]
MKGRKSIILTSLLMLATACQKADGINQFQPTDTEGWNCLDTLVFDVPASTQPHDYEVLIHARITHQFSSKDLWMVVEQQYGDPDSLRPFVDTLTIQVADENGNFIGKGRDLLEYTTPVRVVRLQSGTEGQIRVHHIQTDTHVKGVHDVGIEVRYR